jgi:hypothetical protein
MRGEAHVQRGTERRYYRCPIPTCRRRRCPADLVEGDVLEAIERLRALELALAAARTGGASNPTGSLLDG